LAKITQKTIDLLYSPSIVTKSWSSIQVNIQSIDSDLHTWRDLVPPALDFKDSGDGRIEYERGSRTLGFLYYMSWMFATRPCLCRPDRRIVSQTERSSDFNHTKAAQCVMAARSAIRLLPESFDPVDLYETGPWYIQINVIMQACAVIMLELSLSPSRSDETEELITNAKAVVTWLREMAKHSTSALHAWRKCLDLLAGLAPRLGADISDIASVTPDANPDEHIGRHHSMFPGNRTPSVEDAAGPSVPAESDHLLPQSQLPLRQFDSTGSHAQLPVLPLQAEFSVLVPSFPIQRTWPENISYAIDPSLVQIFDDQGFIDIDPGLPNSFIPWDPQMFATVQPLLFIPGEQPPSGITGQYGSQEEGQPEATDPGSTRL
jgi:hypothetical protein